MFLRLGVSFLTFEVRVSYVSGIEILTFGG